MDATHPTLRRVHAPQQPTLEQATDAASHRRFQRPSRAYKVQETEARTALTDCRFGNEVVWSLNPYVGCSHACVYCYVPDVSRVERDAWGQYVAAKTNLPNLLAKEMRRKQRRPVFLSSATDPYQPAESSQGLTRRCLEVMARHDWPLQVLTRSPLILRDLDLLNRFEQVEVGMSIPTLDDAARRIIEPGAPSIAVRLRTIRALADAGFQPFVNVAPAYPFTTHAPDAMAAALKDAGAHTVHTFGWGYLDGVLPALERTVAGTTLERFVTEVQHPGYRERQIRALRGAMDRAGLRAQRTIQAPATIDGS